MLNSWLTQTLGLKHPILQGGMGPYSTNRLCAAVSNAGGLGVISLMGMGVQHCKATPIDPTLVFGEGTTEDYVRRSLESVKTETSASGGIFGVNCPIPTEFTDAANRLLDAVLKTRSEDPEIHEHLKVVVTSAGNPVPYADRLRETNVRWFHVVPSVRHAQKAVEAGVDAVVVSGHEGGGHISWEPVHSMVLIPAVVEAISVPVVAAGGLCDSRGLAAAFALGAEGIQMGTRFLATRECDFWDVWKTAVLESGDRDTLVARGMFGPMRMIKNSGARALLQKTLDRSPGFFEGQPDSLDPEILELERKGFAQLAADDPEGSLLLAGEVAGRIKDLPTVESLIENLVQGAEKILTDLPQRVARP